MHGLTHAHSRSRGSVGYWRAPLPLCPTSAFKAQFVETLQLREAQWMKLKEITGRSCFAWPVAGLLAPIPYPGRSQQLPAPLPTTARWASLPGPCCQESCRLVCALPQATLHISPRQQPASAPAMASLPSKAQRPVPMLCWPSCDRQALSLLLRVLYAGDQDLPELHLPSCRYYSPEIKPFAILFFQQLIMLPCVEAITVIQ